MASNFQIALYRFEDKIRLKLYGDFDGSPAHELINNLKKCRNDTLKINIHTQGLDDVYPFGLDVFNKSHITRSACADRNTFSGKKAPHFTKSRSYKSL